MSASHCEGESKEGLHKYLESPTGDGSIKTQREYFPRWLTFRDSLVRKSRMIGRRHRLVDGRMAPLVINHRCPGGVP